MSLITYITKHAFLNNNQTKLVLDIEDYTIFFRVKIKYYQLTINFISDIIYVSIPINCCIMKKTVLIIDDNKLIRNLIKSLLENEGYQVIGATNRGKQAIHMAEELHPDLITLDNLLPDILGIDIVKELKDINKNAKIIIVSALRQEIVIEQALDLGADSYLMKPFTSTELLDSVKQIMA